MPPIAKILRLWCQVHEVDQAVIAKQIGISTSSLSRFLTGKSNLDAGSTVRLLVWLFTSRRLSMTNPADQTPATNSFHWLLPAGREAEVFRLLLPYPTSAEEMRGLLANPSAWFPVLTAPAHYLGPVVQPMVACATPEGPGLQFDPFRVHVWLEALLPGSVHLIGSNIPEVGMLWSHRLPLATVKEMAKDLAEEIDQRTQVPEGRKVH